MIANGNLGDSQALLRGLQLHLHRPAVIGILHSEPLEGVIAKRAQWTEVGVSHAGPHAHQPGGQDIARTRVPRQCAALRHTQHAAADHEVRPVVQQRLNDGLDVTRVITAVAIDEYDDVFRHCIERDDTRKTRSPVTTRFLTDDPCALARGKRRGAVGAAIVDDDDSVEAFAANTTHHAGDRLFLVQRRNDDVHAGSVRAYIAVVRSAAYLTIALGVELLALCGLAATDNLRAHLWRFLLLFGLAAAALLVASRVTRGAGLRLRTILVVAVVLRVPMLFATPSLSGDVWRYLHDGRAQLAGHSPYALPPADDRTASFRGAEHERINHPQLVTIYPPAAQLLFAANAALGSTLLGWRLVLLAAELLIITLLFRLGATSSNLAWYAWHPLAVVETIGSAHLDAVAIALLLAGLYAAGRSRPLAAGAFAGLSIATKFIAAPVILLADQARKPRALLGGAAVIIVLYGLYWAQGRVFGSLATFATSWEANASIYSVLSMLTDGHRGRILAATILVCVYAILWRSTVPTLDRAALFIMSLLLLSPVVHPWYVLWLLAFAPVMTRLKTVALVWSLSIVLSYGGFIWAEYLPVFGLLTAEAIRHFRTRTSIQFPETTLQTPL